ncbi:histidine phosphatase family protein, partial [Paenibacillus lautus]
EARRGDDGRGTRAEGVDVLVVTHGGVIREIAAATVPDTEFWATSVLPGEVLKLQLTWDGARWQGERLSE